MGAEATCALRDRNGRHTGRALLETDELIFRGGGGHRVALPLAALRNVKAENGELLFDAAADSFVLELGDKAEHWAERIRSPRSLLDKLDLKASHGVVVFLWAEAPAALKKLRVLARAIAPDGAVWVIHPKGAASKVKDTDVFAVAKAAGLAATKVVRFSETHTAEKLVIPVAKR